ncbi:MAG TPA: hypothetical protein PLY87_03630 [Planctomycetaceae bacterium]|nr:hypothetical protein [Planctomycetaceae bacterium]
MTPLDFGTRIEYSAEFSGEIAQDATIVCGSGSLVSNSELSAKFTGWTSVVDGSVENGRS